MSEIAKTSFATLLQLIYWSIVEARGYYKGKIRRERETDRQIDRQIDRQRQRETAGKGRVL